MSQISGLQKDIGDLFDIDSGQPVVNSDPTERAKQRAKAATVLKVWGKKNREAKARAWPPPGGTF